MIATIAEMKKKAKNKNKTKTKTKTKNEKQKKFSNGNYHRDHMETRLKETKCPNIIFNLKAIDKNLSLGLIRIRTQIKIKWIISIRVPPGPASIRIASHGRSTTISNMFSFCLLFSYKSR